MSKRDCKLCTGLSAKWNKVILLFEKQRIWDSWELELWGGFDSSVFSRIMNYVKFCSAWPLDFSDAFPGAQQFSFQDIITTTKL